MLNRVLRESFRRRHILYYALLSVLFLHIFWAKATFYTVLMFLFLILLLRMLFQEKKERGPLFRKYLILVGITLGLFAIRYLITDFPYYGFDKLGVILDVTEQKAEYGYKPSTPAMEAAYSMRFFEKGISLGDLLTQYDFHTNLFRTFAGFFGSYAFRGSRLVLPGDGRAVPCAAGAARFSASGSRKKPFTAGRRRLWPFTCFDPVRADRGQLLVRRLPAPGALPAAGPVLHRLPHLPG